MTPGRALGLFLAGLMVLAGATWTLQGLGHVGGSGMSGETTWAVIGPVVAGLGVALFIVVIGGRRSR